MDKILNGNEKSYLTDLIGDVESVAKKSEDILQDVNDMIVDFEENFDELQSGNSNNANLERARKDLKSWIYICQHQLSNLRLSYSDAIKSCKGLIENAEYFIKDLSNVEKLETGTSGLESRIRRLEKLLK